LLLLLLLMSRLLPLCVTSQKSFILRRTTKPGQQVLDWSFQALEAQHLSVKQADRQTA
jgi:hypothetical protein